MTGAIAAGLYASLLHDDGEEDLVRPLIKMRRAQRRARASRAVVAHQEVFPDIARDQPFMTIDLRLLDLAPQRPPQQLHRRRAAGDESTSRRSSRLPLTSAG